MGIKRHKPYDRTTHDGNTVNWRTKAMLLEAEEALGYKLTVTQGSYNAGGVDQSAGTHDGGGAVDLSAYDWKNKVRELRKVGFAAWYRSPAEGDWPAHIHAIALDDEEASSGARAQMVQYRNGTNGLANYGRDDFPTHPDRPFDFAKWQKERALLARLKSLLRKRERLNENVAETRKQLRKVRH